MTRPDPIETRATWTVRLNDRLGTVVVIPGDIPLVDLRARVVNAANAYTVDWSVAHCTHTDGRVMGFRNRSWNGSWPIYDR